MGEETRRYISYLLRLWQADDNHNTVWRASLEDAQTRKVLGFASLEDLIRYLIEETELSLPCSGREETKWIDPKTSS